MFDQGRPGPNEGADHHASNQIAEDASEPEALGDRDGDHGGRQVHERLDQEPLSVHALPPFLSEHRIETGVQPGMAASRLQVQALVA